MSSESTGGEKTRWVGDGAVVVHASRLVDGGLHQLGLDERAPVGHRVVGIEDLEGADGVHLPDGQRHEVGRLPLGRRGQQAGRLAREVESGGLAESQVLDLGQQALLPQPLGDLRRPDVGGLGQDLGGGEALRRVRFGVVEGRAVEVDLIGHGEDRCSG